MNLENKVVLVTGSGSGIGEAVAILFAKEKADVVIVDYNENSAKQAAEKCKVFGSRVLVVHADISKEDEAKNAIEKTINNFGKLDILINNAGIVRLGNLISGTIMDTFDEVMKVNLRSVVLMTSLATPYLIKTKGCIVNTSSIVSSLPKAGYLFPVYSISKIGVDCFTRLSALELASSGIRVNAVNPGPVYTNILANAGLPGGVEDHAALTALGRVSDPQEIADFITYLASDKAKCITGCTYPVDNGMHIM